MGGGSSRPSYPCPSERDAYNDAVDRQAKQLGEVRNLARQLNNTIREINGLSGEVRRYERELALMRERHRGMRDGMVNGINRLLAEGKFELLIDDEAEEKYKYLSYDETYVAEL